jgi:hypothetical protein
MASTRSITLVADPPLREADHATVADMNKRIAVMLLVAAGGAILGQNAGSGALALVGKLNDTSTPLLAASLA